MFEAGRRALLENPTPRLTPLLDDWMRRISASPDAASAAIDRLGSPLHVHDFERFDLNVAALFSIIDALGLKSRIFFARKANRALGLRLNAEPRFGLDCASLSEIRTAERAGYSGDRLLTTGAGKPDELITVALAADARIVIDNLDELIHVAELGGGMTRARYLLRIGSFTNGPAALYSRFGFSPDEAFEVLSGVVPSLPPGFAFEGFQFSLTGYSLDERRSALAQLCELADSVQHRIGIRANVIDIGGGLGMNFLESEEEWDGFRRELAAAAAGKRESFTWDGSCFGLDASGCGSLQLYPFHQPHPAEDGLRYILSGKDERGNTLSDRLRASGVELWLEPGRALTDQCGLTLARVLHRKLDSRGRLIIGLEMNFTQLLSGSEELCVDPLLVMARGAPEEDAIEAFLTGLFCIERDFILKRKVRLPRMPRPGDTILFPNTAPYLMHCFEARSHQSPPANDTLYVRQQTGFRIEPLEGA